MILFEDRTIRPSVFARVREVMESGGIDPRVTPLFDIVIAVTANSESDSMRAVGGFALLGLIAAYQDQIDGGDEIFADLRALFVEVV